MKTADLVLAVVVVVAVLLLLHLAAPAAGGLGRAESFLGTFDYAPQCGAYWPGRRRANCRGITTGVMPSIETDSIEACALGCGRLGGIPP